MGVPLDDVFVCDRGEYHSPAEFRNEMSSSPPFIERTSGSIDTEQVLREVVPLAKLIGLVAVAALIPFALAVTLGITPILFTIVTQFVLAVGSGIVLLYVIARAIQLAEG